jgi:hypothetical protein
MSVTVTNKRIVEQVADKLIVTDIDITQRVLPATVTFDEIVADVEVNREAGTVTVNFEGYESDGFYDGEADIPVAKRDVAEAVASMLEGDGVVVIRESC